MTALQINKTTKIVADELGLLEEAFISPSGEGAPYWNSKKLADIPDLLLSHQMAEGQLGAGSLYWRFQHDDGGPNGHMENTIFPTLGLVVASWANSDLNLWAGILVACEALLGGISSEGMLWECLSPEGNVYYI